MRRTLALVTFACVSAVLLAVLIPLTVVILGVARDRAVSAGGLQITAAVAVLGGTTDRAQIAQGISRITGESGHDLAVHLPGAVPVGTHRANPAQLADAKTRDLPTTLPHHDGLMMLQPVRMGDGGQAVVEVYLPGDSLDRDVVRVLLVLAAVITALLVGSVILVDRLATGLVRAVTNIAVAARRFGAGKLIERIDPAGPPELVEAAISFNVMAEQITTLLAAERELAADLSHRLRTPLTALRLDASRLGDDPKADRVRRATNLLEVELDQLIRAARNPLARPPREPCDLSALLSERVRFWAPLAEDERRRVGLFGVREPVPVSVAADELRAVVDALIGNVFRHTPEGVGFAVRLQTNGPQVLLAVEDAGPGFTDAARALRRGESDGSTGLGLDIARKVAESTGGSVHLGRSRLGGARIELRLARAYT